MNKVQLYLLAAKTLISYPEDWCKGAGMRTKEGWETCLVERGYSFCASTVLCLVGDEIHSHGNIYDIAREYLYNAKPNTWTIPAYNDQEKTTHKMVMKWFDKAIELAGDPNAMSLAWPGQRIRIPRGRTKE